ncbi:MAG: translation initiation factor [Planctomycetaceae bacterium]
MTRLFAGTPFDRPPKCDRCGALEPACTCPPPAPVAVPPEKQQIRIAIERRKNGKTVTALRGASTEADAHLELLTKLKSVCGAGGTFKDDVIEIQGDHVARITETLAKLGYRIRK